MKNKIGIIVPLRSDKMLKRVVDLENFIRSWETTTSGFSDLILVTSGEEIDFYIENLEHTNKSDHITMLSGPSRTIVEVLNDTALSIISNYEIIAFMNDDFIIQTKGWEEEIIQWQEENKGICWGNDLIQGGSLTTHFFMHNSIIKALGFVAPPSLEHFYIDNYWTDLGILIGRSKYFPDLIFEHRHHSVGKNKMDSVYERGELVMDKDKIAFDKYREEGLQLRDAEIVKNYKEN